jgi:hydroxylamine reductase (hybrid-cluster protein)
MEIKTQTETQNKLIEQELIKAFQELQQNDRVETQEFIRNRLKEKNEYLANKLVILLNDKENLLVFYRHITYYYLYRLMNANKSYSEYRAIIAAQTIIFKFIDDIRKELMLL